MSLPPPQNKVLPFKHREPLPMRWVCPPPCNSTRFTLWTDWRAYCSECNGWHYNVTVVVNEEGTERQDIDI